MDVALRVAEKIRPLLVRLLPIQFLRWVKKRLINSKMDRLMQDVDILPFSKETHPSGINLIGYIQGEIGLGQSCRLVAQALDFGGTPFTIYNYEQVSAIRFNDSTWAHKITNTAPYNINIIHINPYEMPLAYNRLGRQLWDERYNIAFWLWELEDFPEEWENALKLADEIWTPSEFASKSIRKTVERKSIEGESIEGESIGGKSEDKPVHTIPYAFTTPDCGGYTRQDFQLPDDKLLFLCMYDCNSTMERKNPLGAIRAYKQAFSESDKHVGLVIKVNNPQKKDIRRIKKELTGYPNIYILSGVMDKKQVNALIACVDVYISLHRAEGFGLVITEAMLLGTPVIATNWSANTEFMNNETAMMVDYNLIEITQDCGPYKAGGRWADPDINQAAGFMRKLSKDEPFRQEISAKAKVYIEEQFAPERTAALIKARVSEIYSEGGRQNGNSDKDDKDHSSNHGRREGRTLLAKKP